jgi:simple sugar transport system ATP-binding protein
MLRLKMNEVPVLQARGIVKIFPGVRACDGVDFTVRRGEIHALMGENGAGKSTLLKVLTGALSRDGGEILLEGQPISPRSPAHAQTLGISTVYQEVNLIPTLSVAENLFLGRQPKKWGKIDWAAMRRGAEAALSRLNVHLDVTRLLGSYSIAIQQMVAIARALDVSAKLLILDEPTSSLDADEVRRLFDLLKQLRSEGLGIVFVTHFLGQVYEITDRITVLRNGKLVGEYLTKDLSKIELIQAMMGRELASFELGETGGEPPKARTIPFLQARKLGRKSAVEEVDLDVAPGEVVGIAGLLGSGRTETARLLFGIDKPDHGEILIDGRRANLSSPRKAIQERFGFCPEDRKTQGIIPDLSVRENVALALQSARGWMRAISKAKQREMADRFIKAINIATRDAETPVKNLSGGNQQKVILARWLASDPRFLILDEPTRGIDVGAKAEIQKLILSLAKEGMSILFISSELEEVVRCCSRVVVLRDRRKVDELRGDVTEEQIMRSIAGGAV